MEVNQQAGVQVIGRVEAQDRMTLHKPDRSFPVSVSWFPPESGGRASGAPPATNGSRYGVVTNMSGSCWSFFLFADGDTWNLGAFLVDEAPWDVVRPGLEIDIYEGRHRVAIATVLGDVYHVPERDMMD